MRDVSIIHFVVVLFTYLDGRGLVSAQTSSVSSILQASSTKPASSPGPVFQNQSSPSKTTTTILTSSTSSTVSAKTTASPAASGLPACANRCQILAQAQVECMQAAPGTDTSSYTATQTAYQQCFCHSSAFLSLQAYSESFCSTECPVLEDRSTIKTYYLNFCQSKLPNSSISTEASNIASGTATDSPSTLTSAPTPARPKLSKAAIIGVAVGASVGLIALCALAYYPVFVAGRRAMRSGTTSLAGSRHRRNSSASKTGATTVTLEGEEDGGGAPIAEIARSPMRRSRRSSFGDIEKGKGRSGKCSLEVQRSPRMPPELVHVISVAAFKE